MQPTSVSNIFNVIATLLFSIPVFADSGRWTISKGDRVLADGVSRSGLVYMFFPTRNKVTVWFPSDAVRSAAYLDFNISDLAIITGCSDLDPQICVGTYVRTPEGRNGSSVVGIFQDGRVYVKSPETHVFTTSYTTWYPDELGR